MFFLPTIPRSATIATSPTPNLFLKDAATGTIVFASVVLPGHMGQEMGRPSWSVTTPTTIWFSSGLRSLE